VQGHGVRLAVDADPERLLDRNGVALCAALRQAGRSDLSD
jgi:hypothetical protein